MTKRTVPICHAELLAPENSQLWPAVLYGISAGSGEIVAVALSQIGNEGGGLYWSWYGFSSYQKWCACFVSLCANECGYIENGIIPRLALCTYGAGWFKERGQWAEPGYEPVAGDIIFFIYDGYSGTTHTGIVVKYEDGIVHTVESNSGNAVRQRTYAVDSKSIYGYGLPAY